jgi:L-Ala-D/L-Glu epimerase
LIPALGDCRGGLVEQPLPADADDVLARLERPIPLCADESCRTLADLDRLDGKYQAINIKLDKAGGLTEALALAEEAKRRGLRIMVGGVISTSLGIAAGAARHTAGRDRRSRRTVAPGARSRGGAALRRQHDPSG